MKLKDAKVGRMVRCTRWCERSVRHAGVGTVTDQLEHEPKDMARIGVAWDDAPGLVAEFYYPQELELVQEADDG